MHNRLSVSKDIIMHSIQYSVCHIETLKLDMILVRIFKFNKGGTILSVVIVVFKNAPFKKDILLV